MRKKTIGCVLFLLWVGILSLQAQGLKFRVVSFGEDPFDLSARSEQYQEVDGSGSLYAIIKVISETPDDDVSAYQYNFGMMNHKVKEHNGEVWVYVQKNAKTVTIMRQGYQTVSRYDLGTTIEAGKTYKLVLSAQGPKVYTAPTPITGTLSLSSEPLGASIKIDGKDYGTTPRIISNLLIGQHTLTLNYAGYNEEKKTIEVKEGEIIEISHTLNIIPPEEKTFTVGGVSFVMKRVEGGTFRMGATREQEGDETDDEKPVHSVTLSDYYIGESEVTQALWQAVMGSNPSHFKDTNLPVENVSWNDCQEFIRKLNAQTGQRFRLLTEAEWEYAARGGKKSRGYKYSGSNDCESVAWSTENSICTKRVKTKQANELGLYDMSGNVWELCQDKYGKYSSNAQTNPTGSASGSDRVYRGGGWGDSDWYCRVSERLGGISPSYRSDGLGLRLAL